MSDHIPGVTKMIEELNEMERLARVRLKYIHRLERELTAAHERIKNLESALSTVENIDKVNAYQDLESANERIKRMEEMYEGEIGENEQFLGSNLQGLLIRELNWSKERIKRLEKDLNELRSDEARLLNLNGELERRIKLILEGGDKMFPWSERVGQEFWIQAKEAKP